MSTITTIVVAFIIGYFFIAIESVTKINKAAIAVLMCVVCWTLLALGLGDLPANLGTFQIHLKDASELEEALIASLGDAGTTLFFLMGAISMV